MRELKQAANQCHRLDSVDLLTRTQQMALAPSLPPPFSVKQESNAENVMLSCADDSRYVVHSCHSVFFPELFHYNSSRRGPLISQSEINVRARKQK